MKKLIFICQICKKKIAVSAEAIKKETEKELKAGKWTCGDCEEGLINYTCKRCGHSWVPRYPRKPKRCAKCNSPYWDRERQIVSKCKECGFPLLGKFTDHYYQVEGTDVYHKTKVVMKLDKKLEGIFEIKEISLHELSGGYHDLKCFKKAVEKLTEKD